MSTRDRLFEAAKYIYAHSGLNALSIREVGRRAGMSAMAIYRHFPDKDSLIDALMDDGLAAWDGIAAAIETDDSIVWLRRLLEEYRDFALDQPHRFDAAFLLPARKARTFPTDFEARRSPVVNRMLVQIQRAQADHRLADAPPLDIALLLAAAAQGLVSMHRAGRFSSDAAFRKAYRSALQRMLASLAGPKGLAAHATRHTKRISKR